MWKRSTERNEKFSDENTCLFVKIYFYLRYLEKQSAKNVDLVFIWLFSFESEILKLPKIFQVDQSLQILKLTHSWMRKVICFQLLGFSSEWVFKVHISEIETQNYRIVPYSIL